MSKAPASSGGFTPADDSNVIAWYDPSVGAGVGYTLNGSSETETIIDLSGNSNTLSRETTGFAINSGAKNGLDTFLVTLDRMAGAISGTNNQPWSIIYVFQYNGTVDNTGENVFTNSAGSAWSIATDHGDFNTPPNTISRIAPGSGALRPDTGTDNNWHIITVVMDGADTRAYIDSTDETSYESDSCTDVTQVALANFRWGIGLTSGNFGDVLLIGGDVTAGENFSNYFDYLNNKWAVV